MKLTLETKILGGFALALTLLAGIGVVSFRSTRRLNEDAAWVKHSQEVLTHLASLLSTMTDMETGQRGYTITGDEKFLEPYHQAVARADAEFRALRELTADNPRQQERLSRLEPLIVARLAFSKTVITLRRNPGFTAAQQETATGKGRQIQDGIRSITAEMEQEENGLSRQRERRTRTTARRTEGVIALGSVLMVAVLGLAMLTIHREFAARFRAEAGLQQAHDELERRVTERTNALSHANRALRAISECSQLLVRVTDERTLLDGVCRLLVEHGGYRMAWVGFAEQDVAKTVRPVAQAGFAAGYLDTVNLTWADTEPGRGPTGVAIRTGQHVIARNIPTDPAYGPWRAAALQRGYASSIALPLVSEGTTLGALMAYAAESDAFDPDEMALLNDLAGDLAYGITALRTHLERERVQAALRESQALVRVVTEGTPDAIYVKDPQGRYLMANTGTLRFLGKTQAEVIGQDDTTLFPPEDARQIMAGDRRVMDSGATQTYEERVTLQGQTRTFLSTKGPWRDAQGRVVGLFGIARDISERKLAEALINGQKRVLEMIASGAALPETLAALVRFIEAQAPGMSGSILLLDEDGVHVRHGAAPSLPPEFVAAIDGQPIGPCAGSCGTAAYRKEAVFVADLATDPLWTDYKAAAVPHGLRACWSTPIFDAHHQVLGTFAMYYGQPALPQPEHLRLIEMATHSAAIAISRHRSEAERARLFNHSLDLLCVGGFDGFFRQLNPAWQETLGWTVDELKAKPWLEFVHPDDRAATVQEGQRLFLGEAVRGFENRYQHKNGSYRWLSWNAFPLAEARASFGVVRDVTALKQSQTALTASERRYRSLFDNMPAGFAVFEVVPGASGLAADLVLVAANHGFERTTGLKAPEVIGKRLTQVLPGIEQDAADWIGTYGKVALTGVPRQFEQASERLGCHYSVTAYQPAPNQCAVTFLDITERKHAEAAVRDSETRFRQLFAASPDALFLLDAAGRFRDCNETAEQRYGYRRAELLQMTARDLAAPDLRDQAAPQVKRALETGGAFEWRHRRKDGSELPVEISAKPLALGGQTFILSSVRDVTERQRLEQERHRFALLAESSSEFIGMCDLDLKPLYVNPAGVRMVGLPDMAAACSVPVQDYFFPEDQRFIAEEFFPRVLREGHGAVEIRLRHFQTGEPIWMFYYLFSVRDATGTMVGWATVSRDITERKRAEVALHESEERLRLALDAAHMGTFDWDVPGNRIVWSHWHEELWGFKPGEFGGNYESFARRVHPEDMPGINAEVARCIAARAPFAHDFRVVWPDGSVHWILATGEFTFDTAGQAVRMRGTVKEITERKQADAELRQSREQLRALTARLETLQEQERTRISREIHDELGQMLTGIKMDLRWIEHHLDALGADRRLNPILDRLLATTELTDATVKTVQRIAAELRPGILDKLGLGTALQFEASQFQQRSGLSCQVRLPDPEPALPPPTATALFRIFQETLTNVARHAHATAVEVDFRAEPGGCRLEVRDNGCGIAGVNLASPTSLGLLGMQERARLLGGEVAFTPRPGGGTVVSVRMPNPATA